MLRAIRKEIDQAVANGDSKAFDHAKFKLKQLEERMVRDEDNAAILGDPLYVKRSEEINRKMLKAIDAKLAILNNL